MKNFLRNLLGPFYPSFKDIYYTIKKVHFKVFGERKGTLVYLGLNTGESFSRIYYKFEKLIKIKKI